MKMINHRLLFSSIAVTFMMGCRKPYLPPVGARTSNYLVVDGVINAGQDSTVIHLSRTVPLSDTVGTVPELNASVTIQSDANGNYPLTETGNGYYAFPGLNLSSSNKYRLKITTIDNHIYQSDFVEVKNSPPIDSVYFLVKSNGVQINADTHDPADKTTYYRWAFDETYQIHSQFNAVVKFVRFPKDTVVGRPIDEQIYSCWVSNISNNIILNSSAKLSHDVIANNQINFIGSTSEKLAVRYSAMVKQYALTREAYNYWQQLKKNTEQLGSIFDAQPSGISGNIHSVTNPGEPVLGYVSAGSVAKTRIFIDTHQLPAWQPVTPYKGCKMENVYYLNAATGVKEVQEYIYSGIKDPINPIQPPKSIIIGFTESDPICVDCTLRGSNKQPDFWIKR